ncbi:hypothetical protein M758_UG231000 [Ceratodon purpureus]|nr:hypothetical protein M758_UG231000 [Ceratodon purpureus]KAG0596187.1 hypothetical protein M758_UG231000 [Ceratodon purpureus]
MPGKNTMKSLSPNMQTRSPTNGKQTEEASKVYHDISTDEEDAGQVRFRKRNLSLARERGVPIQHRYRDHIEVQGGSLG